MPELLAFKNVAEVNLNHGHRQGAQGVQNRNGRMRIRGCIEDERARRLPRLLDPAHKFALVVRLPEINLHAGGASLLPEQPLYIRQRLPAIDLRLPFADKIQIRPLRMKTRFMGSSTIS